MTTYAVLVTFKTRDREGYTREGNRAYLTGLSKEHAEAIARVTRAGECARTGEWDHKLTVAEEYGT